MNQDPMQLMDDFAKVVEALAGMRAQLIAAGFREDHAGEIILTLLSQKLPS